MAFQGHIQLGPQVLPEISWSSPEPLKMPGDEIKWQHLQVSSSIFISGRSLFCAWPDGTENYDQAQCVCSAAQAHWLVALGWKSYHVSEFPKAAKNKMPDPITKAAFFTESKSPPEPSCAPRGRGGKRKETSMLVIVCSIRISNCLFLYIYD